ncbi:unnamed protein product, partial [Polarella glacialis]
ELNLREAVMNFLHRRKSSAAAPLLSDLSKDPNVSRARETLLPSEVPLRDWLDRRIGGEVELKREKGGNFLVQLRASVTSSVPAAPASSGSSKGKGKTGNGHVSVESLQKIREEFFRNLPDDSFTSEEEALRDSLLSFLENWTGESLPMLSRASVDPVVRKCRTAALPQGNAVSLKDWIERRLGGELQAVKDEKGLIVLGIAGDIDLPGLGQAAADSESKRRRTS